jgi:hypothetical protein
MVYIIYLILYIFNHFVYLASKSRHEKNGKNKKKNNKIGSEEGEEPWAWETEISAPLPTPASDDGPHEELVPYSACGSVWFHVDNVSQYIRKLCKFYSPITPFGSCVILRRKPYWTDTPNTPVTSQTPEPSHSRTMPETVKTVSQKEIVDFHSIPDSFNLTIQFEESNSKVLSIMNYHLDKSSGVESAFYMCMH